MLTRLRIQNLALVEDLILDLESGFTVLTGETGAGKSLLVDALSLLVGSRGDSDTVRRGEDRAVVEGTLQVPRAPWEIFLETKGFKIEFLFSSVARCPQRVDPRHGLIKAFVH